MTILHKLVSFCNSYPVGSIYHETTSNILKNLDGIKHYTIDVLAERCYTSPTTINRIVRLLGCISYKDFKRSIVDNVENYPLLNRCFPTDTTMEPIGDAYLQFFREQLQYLEELCKNIDMDRICEAIHRHTSIRLYSDFAANYAKRQFQLDLAVSGKDTAFLANLDDCFKDIVHFSKHTMLIISAATNASLFAKQMELMQLARSKEAAILVLCPKNAPNVHKYADYLISYNGTGTAMNQYMVDLLINLITIRYRHLYID